MLRCPYCCHWCWFVSFRPIFLIDPCVFAGVVFRLFCVGFGSRYFCGIGLFVFCFYFWRALLIVSFIWPFLDIRQPAFFRQLRVILRCSFGFCLLYFAFFVFSTLSLQLSTFCNGFASFGFVLFCLICHCRRDCFLSLVSVFLFNVFVIVFGDDLCVFSGLADFDDFDFCCVFFFVCTFCGFGLLHFLIFLSYRFFSFVRFCSSVFCACVFNSPFIERSSNFDCAFVWVIFFMILFGIVRRCCKLMHILLVDCCSETKCSRLIFCRF